MTRAHQTLKPIRAGSVPDLARLRQNQADCRPRMVGRESAVPIVVTIPTKATFSRYFLPVRPILAYKDVLIWRRSTSRQRPAPRPKID